MENRDRRGTTVTPTPAATRTPPLTVESLLNQSPRHSAMVDAGESSGPSLDSYSYGGTAQQPTVAFRDMYITAPSTMFASGPSTMVSAGSSWPWDSSMYEKFGQLYYEAVKDVETVDSQIAIKMNTAKKQVTYVRMAYESVLPALNMSGGSSVLSVLIHGTSNTPSSYKARIVTLYREHMFYDDKDQLDLKIASELGLKTSDVTPVRFLYEAASLGFGHLGGLEALSSISNGVSRGEMVEDRKMKTHWTKAGEENLLELSGKKLTVKDTKEKLTVKDTKEKLTVPKHSKLS